MQREIQSHLPLKLKPFVTLRGITGSKTMFKPGTIELNGIKISISVKDDFKSLANKINAKKLCKVEAELISTESGLKMLIKSRDKIVEFNDPKGVCLNLYNKGEFGTDKTSVIQFIRQYPGQKPDNIILNYTNFNKNQFSESRNYVSELARLHLAKIYETNNLINDESNLDDSNLVQAPRIVNPISYLSAPDVPAFSILIDDNLSNQMVPLSAVFDHPLLDSSPSLPEYIVPEPVTLSNRVADRNKLAKSLVIRVFNAVESNLGTFINPQRKEVLLSRFTQALNNNSNITLDNIKQRAGRDCLSGLIYNRLESDKPGRNWWPPFNFPANYDLSFTKENQITNWLENLSL